MAMDSDYRTGIPVRSRGGDSQALILRLLLGQRIRRTADAAATVVPFGGPFGTVDAFEQQLLNFPGICYINSSSTAWSPDSLGNPG